MDYLEVDMAYPAQVKKTAFGKKEVEELTNEEVVKRFGVGRNSVSQ